MSKEFFASSWLDNFLLKNTNETFKGKHGFLSIFEALRLYFKCFNVKYSFINLLGVLKHQTSKIVLLAQNVKMLTIFSWSSISNFYWGSDYTIGTSRNKTLALAYLLTKLVFTWPKSQDKNLNILRMKRAFKMK